VLEEIDEDEEDEEDELFNWRKIANKENFNENSNKMGRF
jgi:hypothetical protein